MKFNDNRVTSLFWLAGVASTRQQTRTLGLHEDNTPRTNSPPLRITQEKPKTYGVSHEADKRVGRGWFSTCQEGEGKSVASTTIL
jgi:hypothetical protein